LLQARSTAYDYDSALRGSHVTVFTQNCALRKRVISGPIFNLPPTAASNWSGMSAAGRRSNRGKSTVLELW
jgi:hypothetical protein